MRSVVQDWLGSDNISLKQQTVVLSALRGCDGQSKHDISKKFIRKIRGVVLVNAATDQTTFMQNIMTLKDVREFAEDCDKYPIHFVMHLCHCCEVIGFKHPKSIVQHWFQQAYLTIVDALHLKPESEAECDSRLIDGVDTPFT